MVTKTEKGRKVIMIWAEDTDRLRRLSRLTGRTQVDLLHEAIAELAQRYTTFQEDVAHD